MDYAKKKNTVLEICTLVSIFPHLLCAKNLTTNQKNLNNPIPEPAIIPPRKKGRNCKSKFHLGL